MPSRPMSDGHRTRLEGSAEMLTTNSGITPTKPPPMMVGQREPGLLTRFAGRPAMVQTMVDVTTDGAVRTERQREGGGAPRERQPIRTSRWASVVARMGRWLGHPPLEAAPAPAVAAVNPP